MVGDSDRRKIFRLESTFLERLADYLVRAPQDLQRIVLHPAGPRKYLFMLLLRDRDNSSRTIEYYEPRARRSLVDCADVIFHYPLSGFLNRIRHQVDSRKTAENQASPRHTGMYAISVLYASN